MKQWRLTLFFFLLFSFCAGTIDAQCSICTKTAQQLGEGPAEGLNSGILYLMATPFVVMGYIGYRWWKKEKEVIAHEKRD